MNMKYKLQGNQILEITTIVLDLNGTLAVSGLIPDGVKVRINQLKKIGIDVVLFSGDKRGNARSLADDLGISFTKSRTAMEKEKFFLQYDPKKTAAIGNARIDNGKFKHAAVSVGTIQAEGLHTGVLRYVDILVPSILDALDLFIDPNSLCATLKE